MQLRVIKDAYYVTMDLENLGPVDRDTFESSFTHFLVEGDVWEKVGEEMIDGELYEYFACVEGEYEGETSDGMWEYKYVTEYFEVIA